MMNDVPRDGAPSAGTVAPLSKTTRWTIAMVFLGSLITPLFHQGTLIDHMPLPWYVVGTTLGVLAAVWLDVLMARGKASLNELNDLKLAAALLMLPVFGGVLGSYYARLAFEVIAFAGHAPKTVKISAAVTSVSNGRGGPRGYVLPYPGARELQVDVTGDLYDQFDPYRQPGRDCLILDIEIGRGGVKRTMLPAMFDPSFGTEHWQQCAGYQPAEEQAPAL